jgi:pyrroline-5-carboxylate reductase
MNVGIVGTGAMGAMLIRAHARFGHAEDFTVHAANRSAAPLDALAAQVPGLHTGTAEEVAALADLLIICVTASPYLQVAAALGRHMSPGKPIVCISSGVSLSDLAAVVPQPIVKLVPNVAHEVGRGVALLVPGPRATADHVEQVCSFVKAFSCPMVIEEFDARVATDLSSCGPAIFASYAQLLAASAARHARALTTEQLTQMSSETLAGVGALLDAGWSASRIADAVATHGGTTEAALHILRERLPRVLDELHCATRDRETQLRNRARNRAPDRSD